MKRKIVRHGSSSLTITLPIKWVEKFGLKKGDELSVEEEGPSLLLSTSQESAVSKKIFSANSVGVSNKNNLSHLYQLGYDEIEIIFDDPQTLIDIKQRLPSCMGFELIDQKKNRVYIKNIAVTMESEFDTLLRKSFQITNEMAKELVLALKNDDFSGLSEIRQLESLNNKFTDICIRILNKRGHKIQKRTMQMYEIIKNIERIADEFKYVCDVFEGNLIPIKKESVELFSLAVDYYLTFYEMFYKFSPELKVKLYCDKPKLTSKIKLALEKSQGKESLFLHHILSLINKTYDGAGGYFAFVL